MRMRSWVRKSSSANRPPAVRQGTSQTPSNVPITSAVSAWSLIGLKATGELDAGRCELSAIGEHGAHWIAGNLRLDLASLNKVEMLPWDLWGASWEPGEQPTEAQLQLCDTVANLTVDPDARFGELRDCYENDDSLRMDGTVFNVARGQVETV